MDKFFNTIFSLKKKRGYYSVISTNNKLESKEIGQIEGSLVGSLTYRDGRNRLLFRRSSKRPLDLLTISPNGEYIAYICYNINEVCIYDIKLGKSLSLIKGKTNYKNPCILKHLWVDNKRLLLSGLEEINGLWIKEIDSNLFKIIEGIDEDSYSGLSIDSNLNIVYFTMEGNEIYIFNLESNDIKKIYKGQWLVNTKISPTGNYLAFIEKNWKGKFNRRNLLIMDLETNIINEICEEKEVYDFVWDKSGQSIALLDSSYELSLFNIRNNQIDIVQQINYEIIDGIDINEGIIHPTPIGNGWLVLDSEQPFIITPQKAKINLNLDLTYFLGWN